MGPPTKNSIATAYALATAAVLLFVAAGSLVMMMVRSPSDSPSLAQSAAVAAAGPSTPVEPASTPALAITSPSRSSSGGIRFPFVIQAGSGGVLLDSVEVSGDVYTTGTIEGRGASRVTGSITAMSARGQDRYIELSARSISARETEYTLTSSSDASPSFDRADPIPSAALSAWKALARSGGTSSGRSIGWAGASLGPQVIEGDLRVIQGGALRVSGPLYVTGDVVIDDGAVVSSGSSEKSSVIIAEGSISVSGGSRSPDGPASRLLLVSLDTGEAVSLRGGSGDAILAAPNGTVRVSEGASAAAIFAKRAIVEGGARISSAGLTLSF